MKHYLKSFQIKLSEKLPSPDKFSVMTYLAQFYHKFTEQDPDSGFSSQVCEIF